MPLRSVLSVQIGSAIGTLDITNFWTLANSAWSAQMTAQPELDGVMIVSPSKSQVPPLRMVE